MSKRYRALRTIGTIYKVLGIIAGIFTILAVLGLCLTSVLGGAAFNSVAREFGDIGGIGRMGGMLGSIGGGLVGGLITGFFAIIYGGGVSITLYGMGEGVFLLLALEENTRATAALLQQRTPNTHQNLPPQ